MGLQIKRRTRTRQIKRRHRLANFFIQEPPQMMKTEHDVMEDVALESSQSGHLEIYYIDLKMYCKPLSKLSHYFFTDFNKKAGKFSFAYEI
jgi:hypothetical protein